MPFFRSSRPPRLFILGLDGSPLPLLRQLMKQGDLPNLARCFEEGSAVEMNSSFPDVSAVAWTSVNTGMNPGKHGIYGFVDRRPGTFDLEVMTSTHVKAKTVWELASEAGKFPIAVNVPLSFPPQRINGIVVSDFLAPSLNKAVHPMSLLSSLEAIGYRIDTDPWVARQSLDDFLEDFKVTASRRAEAVLSLMRSQPWQFFMVVFMETDRLHHFMWQYMEDGDDNYGRKFVDAYRHIDHLAGEILNELSKDDELIVMSDHGFTTLRKEVYLNVWLQEHGYLHFSDEGRELSGLASSTKAYSLDPGRIYLNLRGREPGGTTTLDQATGILQALEADLMELRDPDSGDQVVQHVHRADDVYSGSERSRAPDLLVMPHDGYDIKGTFESSTLMGRGKLVGMHKYDNATFFVRGRKIHTGHASVHDVLPTACHLLDLACPSDVDGKVLV